MNGKADGCLRMIGTGGETGFKSPWQAGPNGSPEPLSLETFFYDHFDHKKMVILYFKNRESRIVFSLIIGYFVFNSIEQSDA
jgi:hypothetical protein